MQKKYLFVLLAIIALGAFLRFYQIADIPPGLYPDEAMNGNNALEANATGHWRVFYPENNGREGLFINLQAISVAAFGAKPWALRIVSAIIGTLTILGIYLVTKELFAKKEHWIPDQVGNDKIRKSDFPREVRLPLSIGNRKSEIGNHEVALLSAFFLATSYWHLNFSRIGFRAIMLPLIASFALYFLLRGLRTGYMPSLIAAGIFTGLGAYTYIAYRFMIFVFAVPVVAAMRRWKKDKNDVRDLAARKSDFLREVGLPHKCAPCAIALYGFVALIVILPLILYFSQNPHDFFNRAGDISVFSASSPLKEFAKSAFLTLSMLFYKGDGNWRHNLAYAPELNPLVALFFIIGIIALIRKPITYHLSPITLFVWLFAMLLPSALTREGVPHALRAIGIIPPVMILSALGAERIWGAANAWIGREKMRWPDKIFQLERIRRELLTLFVIVLLTIPLATYRDYFLRWAERPETYDAFDTSTWRLGQYLASLPGDTKKYIIVNTLGVKIRGIPASAQTVMFATDTFRDASRNDKNLLYLLRDHTDAITPAPDTPVAIALLNGTDHALIRALRQRFPTLKASAPGDFIVLKNF